jgi:diguanylate cyclase (GGDEF)-like protein
VGVPWVTAHAFEALVVTIVLSFLFLAIAKERVEFEQRAMATRDPLTGVLNRRAFVDAGERRLSGASPGSESTMLLLDVDHFKRINDQHGHAAGDAVLNALCRVAERHLPEGAVFARLGGEEFGCFLPGASLLEGYYTAEYLRNAVALTPLEVNGRSLAVTVSIGVAGTPAWGLDLAALISAADAAMYRAKRAGRNRVWYAPEPSALAA